MSVATASWTCSPTLPWFERSSRNWIKSSSRGSAVSPAWSEPLNRPWPRHCRCEEAGESSVEYQPVLSCPAVKVRGDKKVSETRRKTLCLIDSWKTGCSRRICSGSCSRSGLRCRISRIMRLVQIITELTKGKEGIKNENGICKPTVGIFISQFITTNGYIHDINQQQLNAICTGSEHSSWRCETL